MAHLSRDYHTWLWAACWARLFTSFLETSPSECMRFYWLEATIPVDNCFIPTHLRYALVARIWANRTCGAALTEGLALKLKHPMAWWRHHGPHRLLSGQFSPTTLVNFGVSGSLGFEDFIKLMKLTEALWMPSPNSRPLKVTPRRKHSVEITGKEKTEWWGEKIIKALDGGSKDSLLNWATFCLSWPVISMWNMWETFCGRQGAGFIHSRC